MKLAEQIDSVLRLIVDEPDDVEVEEIQTSSATVFEVSVAEDDLGKVIGRQGRTARAFRTLLGERGVRDGERYEFEIVDD